ncbi:MAG: DNA-binding protein [Thermodesulfobacteriota bacterium]
MKKTALYGITICLSLTLGAYSSQAQDTKKENENKTPAATAATSAPGTLTGKVLETMDSGGYTYLQLDTGLSQPWVAIPQAAVKVGEEVSCQPGMTMKNFSSKTLNRTFDSIVFSGGLAGAAASPQGNGMGSMANPHKAKAKATGDDSFASAIQAERGAPVAQQQPATGSGGSLGAITPFSEVKVEKAAGANGYTVSDIFAKREELNGKKVAIKGKVVKFSPMIMGRNWIHLQDGSGDPMNNTHDLVVTTTEQVKAEDVITVEGVLAADKDFGAGYRYDAIVEEAKVLK